MGNDYSVITKSDWPSIKAHAKAWNDVPLAPGDIYISNSLRFILKLMVGKNLLAKDIKLSNVKVNFQSNLLVKNSIMITLNFMFVVKVEIFHTILVQQLVTYYSWQNYVSFVTMYVLAIPINTMKVDWE